MKRPPVNILAALDAMTARADYFERKHAELQREYDRLADRLMTRGNPVKGKRTPWTAENYDAAAELQILHMDPMALIEERRAMTFTYDENGMSA